MPMKPQTLAQKRGRVPSKEYDMRRRDTAGKKIRSSARWRKVRKMVLDMNPLCVVCDANGSKVVAVDVDHIIPLALQPDLAFDTSNLQGLCRSCHNCKTAQE